MSETNYWSRMRRRRLSRRTMLGASARAGVGAAGLALVGCGDDDDDDAVTETPTDQTEDQTADQTADQVDDQEEPADQTDEPADEEVPGDQAVGAITRGGILRFSTPAATHDYFDPHRAVFGPTQFWMGLYMNYMIRWRNKEQAVLEADVAGLPEIPDEETYVFAVTDGARFWDRFPTEGGRAVTADDLRFNVQRRIDAVDASGAEDGTFLTATAYRKTAAMEVVDDRTISMRTNGPDATYLSSVHANPFGWVTSPEAADEFGDRWRDETTNVELSSGTGMFIPESYSPDVGIFMARNPNYWKMGTDGQALPYFDRAEFNNITDPTAVEAAYRSQQIDSGGFPLSKLQVEGLQADFPEHIQNQVAFGFTIQSRWNYSTAWPGSDGLGNPWADRRFAQAFAVAADPYQLIDTVYLGDARASLSPSAPWFNQAWTVPQDELVTYPGWRPDRAAELELIGQLLDASGFDRSRVIEPIVPDVWEATYPGITEVMVAMYTEAGFNVQADVQPYTVVLQRLEDGTYPSDMPSWTNPPSDLDPTTGWNNGYIPGASTNLLDYDYQPVTDIVTQMQVTLDMDERITMAQEVNRILAGVHPDHGLDGFAPSRGIMNGIQRTLDWPYVHGGADTLQFAHASHRHDDTWLNTGHPDYPA